MYVRMSEGLGQAPIALTPDQLRQVQKAIDHALKVSGQIIKMLEDILLKGFLPAKGHRLDCALIANFNLSQNDPTFRARVSDIRQKLLDIYIPLSKRTIINISPNLATDCKELGAFFDKSSNTIHVCLSFFQSLTDLGRMARVIHELLHAYARLGLDVENWGTQKSRAGCTVGAKYDSKPEVLVGNADSYEQFVLNLMEGSKEQ